MSVNATTPAAPAAQGTPNAAADAGKNAPTPPAAGTTPETKPATPETGKGGDAAGTKPETGKETKPAVEVKYELKVPEESLLQETAAAEVTEFAKAHKLAPEVAQKVLEGRHEAVSAFAKENEAAALKAGEGWKAEAEKRYGDKFAAANEDVKRFVTKFGPQGFAERLEKSPFRFQPDFFDTLAAAGAQLHDDKFVGGESRTTDDLSKIADPRQRLAEFHRRDMAGQQK